MIRIQPEAPINVGVANMNFLYLSWDSCQPNGTTGLKQNKTKQNKQNKIKHPSPQKTNNKQKKSTKNTISVIA